MKKINESETIELIGKNNSFLKVKLNSIVWIETINDEDYFNIGTYGAHILSIKNECLDKLIGQWIKIIN